MFKKTITALLLIIAILSLSACIKEPIEPKEPIDTTVYTLSYALDGGTLKITNPGSYNSQTPSFTLNNPTKEYFTFVGWSTSDDLSNPVLDVTISPGTKGNTTFYAVWHKFITASISANPEYFSSCTPNIIDRELGETVELEFIVDPKYYGFTVEYWVTAYSKISSRPEPVSNIVVLSDKLVIPYTITAYISEIYLNAETITPPHRNGIWVKNFFSSNNSYGGFSFFNGEIGEAVELEILPDSMFHGWTFEYYFGEKLPEGVKPQLSTIILTEKITLNYTMTKSCHYLEFYVDEISPPQIIN